MGKTNFIRVKICYSTSHPTVEGSRLHDKCGNSVLVIPVRRASLQTRQYLRSGNQFILDQRLLLAAPTPARRFQLSAFMAIHNLDQGYCSICKMKELHVSTARILYRTSRVIFQGIPEYEVYEDFETGLSHGGAWHDTMDSGTMDERENTSAFHGRASSLRRSYKGAQTLCRLLLHDLLPYARTNTQNLRR